MSKYMSICDLLQARASAAPDANAIMAPGCLPLSYSGLSLQIRTASAKLNEWGVKREARVAIVLPNGPEMATAFLTAAAVGAAAPLNPSYGREEFEFYLADLRASALLVAAGSTSSARDAAAGRGIPIVEIRPVREAGAGVFEMACDRPSPPAEPDSARPGDTALVLHTSGTTSRPKIVPLTHANLCASAHSIAKTLALGPQDICLNIMPLFHIHGLVSALLSSLSAGAAVACAPGLDASKFLDWLETFRPTWYTAVPTMHQAILERAELEPKRVAASLRFVRSSSASLPPRIMERLERCFGIPVVEAYGMTEASHQMASNPLPPGERKPGSVGLAAGPEVAVMDGAGRLLGNGETGEIVIRGESVMAQYENNPAANLSSFSDGWFRTGDQGCFDSSGYLFLRGRLKEIINRGGEKISPREVDEALMEHPGILQAVTFAAPHPTLGEDVAVAVVPAPGFSLAEKDVREFAFRRLAPHKVPSRVAVVDSIPKGPTGKFQRIGLFSQLADKLAAPFVGPRDEVERTLAGIWKNVLGREVGIHDNFFAAGGDSLLAIQALSRARSLLHVDLPVDVGFRGPTVAGLAEEIRKRRALAEKIVGEALDELDGISEEEARRRLEEEPR